MCTEKNGSKEVIVATKEEVSNVLALLSKRADKLADPYGKVTFNSSHPLDQGMIGTIRYLRQEKRKGKVISV
jgi:hypothetical protein